MLARVRSAAVIGLEAVPVDVEVDVAAGIPTFSIVGLPDAAVREARERVRAAIRNAGYEMPARRVTVNLAPADIRKEGPAFDLAIALGILAATEQIPAGSLAGYVVAGELSLDGAVRPVAGVLSVALGSRRRDLRGLVVPEANAAEAAIVDGVPVCPTGTLRDTAAAIAGLEPFPPVEHAPPAADPSPDVDLAEVRGQARARRALEIAAAGAHNLLLIGPPGSGKTMLARRLPTILPPLSHDEALDVTRIYSVGGYLRSRGRLLAARPFRAPHHSASLPSLVGGGAVPRPGEASLAHLGVLFLDELPEFQRSALEALRQPLEEGRATVSRVHATVTFPTRCMVVAAMNPCPCGYFGDPMKRCACSRRQRARYLGRLSGPLLDRMDLHVEVPRLAGAELTAAAGAETSAAVRVRVVAARAVQAARAAGTGPDGMTNGTMPISVLREAGALGGAARTFLGQAIDRLALSPRAFDRILRVARTIADLEDAAEIAVPHVAEAIAYRTLDRPMEAAGAAAD